MRGFKQEHVPLPPRILQHPQHWRLERWLVKPGSSVHRQQRIATFRSLQNDALEYAHAPRAGKLVKLNLQQQSLVDPTISPLALLQFCPHSVVFKGICAVCGETAQSLHFAETTNTIERIHVAYASEQLAVSRAEAESRASVNARHLLESRRLSLVLDLDHTLLHATDDLLAPDLVSYFSNLIQLQSVKTFHLGPPPEKKNSARMYVKLRPHLAEFLQRLSKKFELHIYTMGTRSYAAQIANIIDPHKKLFGGRITSREDFAEGQMNQKSIQRLFPCDDSMVLIVDDREDVWISATGQSFMPNLVRASPYHFWDGVAEVHKKIFFRRVHPNVEGNSHNISHPTADTLTAAVATGAHRHEKDHSNKLNAPKPSENGNEVKHANGITSDVTTQPKQRNEGARTHIAPKELELPKNVVRPISPDAVTGPQTVGGAEHVVDAEIVGVTLNGNSQKKEQNGSSSHITELHNPDKLESEKGPNHTQKPPQTASLEGGTPLQPISSNGVVAENVGSLSHDNDGRKDTENVGQQNPSRQNQQPQNASSEEENPMRFTSPNGVATDKNVSADDLLQKWWTKYIESNFPNHLLRLADVLEDCHARFFSIADQARKGSGATQNGSIKRFRPPADVKKILANVRREVLSDCVISFTGVIPTGVDPRSSEFWNLAQRLGAQCSLDFENGHTTHLVASQERGRNTRKYKQAVENGSAFVVSPSWLEHCAIHFERLDEFGYQLDCDNRFKTSEEFKSWVSNNFARVASACRKRSVMQISDRQSGDEPTPKRRKLDSPSPSVRESGSRSPVADGAMLSLLSQDEIGAAIEAAFAME